MDSLDSHRLAAEKLQVYMAINSSPLTHHWSAARATAALKPGHSGYKVTFRKQGKRFQLPTGKSCFPLGAGACPCHP